MRARPDAERMALLAQAAAWIGTVTAVFRGKLETTMIGSQLPGRLRWAERAPIVVLLTVVLLLVASFGRRIAGQGTAPIELISVTTAGNPGGGQLFLDAIPYDTGVASHISADNRYVVFASPSDQMVVGDTNGHQDIFVRDRQTLTTTLVSRTSGGGLANDHSGSPVISANGRYVAFVSLASNIVAGDTNGVPDVFIRDLQTGATSRVSVSTGGVQANASSSDAAISADGRYIAFVSYADNLVAGDTNVFNADVFLRDTVAGTTERVSVRPDGSEIVRADSFYPSISADGRRVAFGVYDNVLAGPPPVNAGPNFHHGIYVRDLNTNQTILVSARPDGSIAEYHYALYPMISANGRYVTFAHWEDLDPNFPDQQDEVDGPYSDIFVRDLQTSITDRVSLPFPGGPVEESGNRPSISGDGRYVTYVSNTSSIRVRDRVAKTTTVIEPPGVTPDGSFDSPSISEDGQLVYFESYASNLVPNDTNDLIDTFVFHTAPSADLSLALTSSTLQPSVNGNITFTVAVTNGGPSNATGVAVRAALPAGLTFVSDTGAGAYSSGTGIWTVGSLAAGSTTTLQIVATFTATTPLSVTAQVSASSPSDPDSTPDNSVATEDDQRTIVLTPGIADLSLTLTPNSATPAVNSNVTFTATLSNGGPGTATGVGLRATLPASLSFVSATASAGSYNSATSSWSLPSVPNGGAPTLQIVARVTATTAVDITAEVSAANQTDPDSTPNNGNTAEDDFALVHLTPTASTGIIVNDATPVVNANDGKCTLIEAIVAANTDAPSGNALGECAGGSGADTIHLRAVTPPYTLVAVHNTVHGATGLPVITSDITIDGAGAAIERVAGSLIGFRLFAVETTGRLLLDHTVVRNGSTGTAGEGPFGGAIFNLGTLELNGSTVSNSVASCDGGGIFSSGPLALRGGTIILGNTSFCSGGGVAAFYAGSVAVDNTTIQSNAAPAGSGGGFYMHGTTTATMTASQVLNNTARVEGGGVFQHGPDANLSIANTTIAGNVVTNGSGGGISNGRLNATVGTPLVLGGTLALNSVVVMGNRITGGYGGGISTSSPLTITSGSILENQITTGSAGCGGGLYNAAVLTVLGSTIAGNSAGTSSGGGICSIGLGALTVTTTFIRSNTSGSFGGGVALFFSPRATFTNSAVFLNSSSVGGGIYSLGANTTTLVLDVTAVQQNLAFGGAGGGLWVQGGTTTLRNTPRVLSNVAATYGGGIAFNYGGTCCPASLTMTGGLIDGNSANGVVASFGGGGGIANFDLNPSSEMTLNGVTISNNHAPSGGNGGGIFNRARLVMTGGVLRANDALSGGALSNGTSFGVGGLAVLTNVAIEDNVATSLGGAVFGANPPGGPATGTTTIIGGTVRNNRAGADGGALFTRPNTLLTVGNGAVITGNVTTGTGGAINSSGTLEVSDTTVANNSATVGGALHIEGRAIIARSTISGNRANFDGGIRVLAGLTDISNTTISGNTAAVGGAGAVQIIGSALPDGTRSSKVVMVASTVTNNVGLPGGIGSQTGYLIAVANILAANRRPDATFSECLGTAGSLWQHGGNLIGQDPGCIIATTASDRLVDPSTVFTAVLGPLANNGGPMQTHALLAGSLALDTGDTAPPGSFDSCPTTDQRGLPRAADGDGDGSSRCDLGAFEQQTPLQAPPATLTALAPASVLAGSPATALTVTGTGFTGGSLVLFNGSSRPLLVRTPNELSVALTAADLALVSDIRTAVITVQNPGAAVSNPLALTIVSARVATVQSRVVMPGASGTVSTAPSVAGQSGASATLTNNGPSSTPVTITVANYATIPVGGTIFAAGGIFDVQITGADATDSVAVRYYYPSTVSAAVELGLQLQYWNGAAWAPVLSAGGTAPVKDTTNNLDGTTSGGRFSVTFDNTSTPRITELGGTVFAIVEAAAGAPVTTALESPAANAAGWHNTNVAVTLKATAPGASIARIEYNLDDRGWKIYTSPVPITSEGIHTLRYRSTTTGGTVETLKTLTVRIDKTAPVLKLRVDPLILWPADGRLRNVEVDAVLKDSLSGADKFTLISVDSNSRDDAGDIVGWTLGTPDTRGQLRAKFTGIFNPRIYRLTYKGVDLAGNETVECEFVLVLQIGANH